MSYMDSINTQPFPLRDHPVDQLLSLAITNTELPGLSPTHFPTLSSWYCCKNLCSPCPMQMWLVKSGETAVENKETKKRQKRWRINSAARREKMGMTEELIVTASILLTQTQNFVSSICHSLYYEGFLILSN
ncbi:hypothetical protein HID58_019288 [Brassica napus]|uniref:Uncharacterized protein n=1 Tax=Brassica napus TaxID=3708 RepID=A0ABQ8DCF3_BRANA|nr:hypothetical protein HID58_019288 [Brassica napus]